MPRREKSATRSGWWPAAVKRILRRLAGRLPYVRDLRAYIHSLERERDALRDELARSKTWVPPGHFYSPIPNVDEIRRREARIFGEPPPSLPAIDLREGEQMALVEQLARFYPELPFPRQQSPETRYWYENWAFSYADAIFLYSMLRQLEPKRMIEAGSGFTSALMLDTSERFLSMPPRFTFIDPDVATLRALLRPGDEPEIIASAVQDVPLTMFDELRADDILFIDSTHVSKTGSDVNHVIFEVLPRLREGVYVHFHDVFYPFEYPKEWAYEGRAWNEDYILRAFLEFNDAFEIVLFGMYLVNAHREWFAANMPLALENPGGSLWLRRRGGR